MQAVAGAPRAVRDLVSRFEAGQTRMDTSTREAKASIASAEAAVEAIELQLALGEHSINCSRLLFGVVSPSPSDYPLLAHLPITFLRCTSPALHLPREPALHKAA
jgi:hypothetical protein